MCDELLRIKDQTQQTKCCRMKSIREVLDTIELQMYFRGLSSATGGHPQESEGFEMKWLEA